MFLFSKKAGSVEQLACGVFNGLVQAQVDKVETIIFVGGWVVLVLLSLGVFGILYSAKKSLLWFGKKKDQIVEQKDKAGKYLEDKKQDIQDRITNRNKSKDNGDNISEEDVEVKKTIVSKLKEKQQDVKKMVSKITNKRKANKEDSDVPSGSDLPVLDKNESNDTEIKKE